MNLSMLFCEYQLRIRPVDAWSIKNNQYMEGMDGVTDEGERKEGGSEEVRKCL